MKTKEIRAFSIDEMQMKLQEAKDKLFKQKLQNSLGQAENPSNIRHTRKNIAKLLTILREKEIETRSTHERESGKKGKS